MFAAGVRPAGAQTADVVFGGLTWRPREMGARPSGLGGAYVAVADDARAALTNPAGIALVPNVEIGLGVGERWGAFATALRGRTIPVSGAPADAASAASPCPPGAQPRPWALAFYAQQTLKHDSGLDVVSGPGLVEQGVLTAEREQVGVAIARGVTPWLNLGLGLNWRHLRLDGSDVVRDAAGVERTRVTLDGDSNKARAVLGALATFGPARSPTQFRVGLAYERDLSAWNVSRREVDVTAGTQAPPARVRIAEPPLFSGGAAWRISDAWLVSTQLDFIAYSEVLRALRHNEAGEEAGRFRLENGFEPRLGVEHTQPSPIGGYLKIRGGLRRETAGRLLYQGPSLARTQAFPDVGPAFRGSAGLSLLAEFYARAARLDLDLSQVVVGRATSLSAAGTRRFSFNLTVRL